MAPPMVYLHADYDSFSSPLRIPRPTTLVLVPYAYPAYERQKCKVVGPTHIKLICFRSFLLMKCLCGDGTERLGWSNAAVHAEIQRKSP